MYQDCKEKLPIVLNEESLPSFSVTAATKAGTPNPLADKPMTLMSYRV